MTRESDGTGIFRRRAAGRGRRLAPAHLLAAVTATFCTGVLAEPIYYVLSQQTSEPTKYDSAKAACDAYRDYVQASNDQNNPGGVAIVKKYPREDLYPSLKMSDYCIVNWSRWSSSFDYWLSVYAGGCLPGRRPKDDAPEYFAEPGDCEPRPCPVPPLSEGYTSDPCSASLEKGKGKDVDRACPRPSILDDPLGEPCLRSKLSYLNIGYSGPTSAIRTPAYQAHLQEAWTKWQQLRQQTDPEIIQACAPIMATIGDEITKHGLDYPPANESAHNDGLAFDISRATIGELIRRISTEWDDVQTYVNSTFGNGESCDLGWGGRFKKPDRVHFYQPKQSD